MVGFSNSGMAGMMDSMSARLGSGGSDGSEPVNVSSSPRVGKMSARGAISTP